MLYLITLVASIIFTVMCFASEVTDGNITHIKNGREPNAGAALFPSIPFIPLFFCGLAWLVNHFLPEDAFTVVLSGFAVLYIWWAWSFRALIIQLSNIKKDLELEQNQHE